MKAGIHMTADPKAPYSVKPVRLEEGAYVRFTADVVRRSGHSAHVANMKGTVVAIEGAVAKVDCGDTFVSDDGRQERFIPVANLERVPN